MPDTPQKTKLVSRDFITIGIFSLILIVIQIVFDTLLALSAIAFPFTYAVAAIPVGIVFMYVVAKVPKTGAIALMATVVALIYFLIGAPGLTPLGAFVGGIVAEVIISSGKYKSFSRNVIGYVAFITIWWFGYMTNMLLFADTYIAEMVAMGIAEETIAPMIAFINGPFFFLVLTATIIGSVLGAFLGRRVLKKHFVKAGIV